MDKRKTSNVLKRFSNGENIPGNTGLPVESVGAAIPLEELSIVEA